MRRAAFFSIMVIGFGAAAHAAPFLSRDGQTSFFDQFAVQSAPRRDQPGLQDGAPPQLKMAGNPGVTAPLVAPPKTDDLAVKNPAPVSQADRLDDLFQRLAHADDSEQASGIALLIQHLWLQSGSDTADLLMGRAVVALGKGDSDLSTKLLDKIVVIDPGWAEAWNKRATLRFLNGDDAGAMDDIAHVLVLEPRHFGALSGMSFILQRSGMKKEALALMRKAAVIYPHNAELEKVKSQLELDVEGRDL